MSWQSYADGLVQQGLLSAALLGFNGSLWAATPRSDLEKTDGPTGQLLVEHFQKPSEFVKHGIVTGNNKVYLFIRNSERSVLGKIGMECLLLVRCGKCVILGTFLQTDLSHCSALMERLADYLVSVGF